MFAAALVCAFIAYVLEHVRRHGHAVLFVLGETAICPWGQGRWGRWVSRSCSGGSEQSSPSRYVLSMQV